MKLVAPANTPALIRALGADPVKLTVAGSVLPDNSYGAITMRRARGSRDPIGSPATCSLTVAVDTPPTWKKGDPLSVQLSDAALTTLFGPHTLTNLATNPRAGTTAHLSNNTANYTATRVTGISGPNGNGITTATEGRPTATYASNPANTVILSIYNADGLQVGPARYVGGWVRCSRAAEVSIYTGTTVGAVKVTLAANVWTWVATAVPNAGQAIVLVSRLAGGAPITTADWAQWTGVMATTPAEGPPARQDYFDGSFPDATAGADIYSSEAANGAATVTPGAAVGFFGADSWTRVDAPGLGVSWRVQSTAAYRLATGATMTAQVGNDGAAPVTVKVTANGVAATAQTITVGPGQVEFIELERVQVMRDPALTVAILDIATTVAGGPSFLVRPVFSGVADHATIVTPDPVDYAWTGTADASTSTRHRPDILAAWAEARYRFTGRISDLTLETTLTGATANVIATGNLAALGADVGDTPWPAEDVNVRVGRVLAAAKAQDPAISYQVSPFGALPVPARDVDRQSAQQLLAELSETIGPRAGMWEHRDGVLFWSDGFDPEDKAPLDLGVEVVTMPLTHVQGDRVNRATVTPSGKPTVGQVLFINHIINPAFEVNTGGWAADSGATLTRDTAVFQAPGVASGKVTATAAGVKGAFCNAGDVYDGAVVPITALVRRATAGPIRMQLGWTGLGTFSAVAEFQLAANTWTRIDAVFGPAPTGATMATLFIQQPDAVVGSVFYIDRVARWDDYTGIPPKSLAYFDGSTAATTDYTFAWEGTAHGSRSFAKATATTPTPTYTWTDLASVATYGALPDQVASMVDVGAATFSWAQLVSRAKDQLLAGGWAPPDLTVDLLPMLDGRVEAARPYDTPVQAAAAILRAELGSPRQLFLDDNPDHMPALGMSDVTTGLHEVITPHRWTITTTAERTS